MRWVRAARSQVREVPPPSALWEASPCGALLAEVASTSLAMRCSGALWLEAESALVVADLHFEKGSSYGARGQFLPPYDTRATLDRLEVEVSATQPRTLVFLGDSFHDRQAEARLDPQDYTRLSELASGRSLLWVVGNHDADGPARLPGEVVQDVEVAGLLLRHEPANGSARGEVSGHLHPCARVSAYGRAVRRRCFLTDGERLILPAFGAYAGGLNALDQAFAGLFGGSPLAGALGAARVHPIGFGSLLPD